MKNVYEIDVDQVKENVLIEVNRYVSNQGGYSIELLDHNIKQILEDGFKKVPSDFKVENKK